MTTYCIGDVQGCCDELRRLLDELRFEPARDRAWFTGDLVNRGPKSLATLRFVRSLGGAAVTVLGNHDLHLLSAALTGRSTRRDTLADVLAAPDRDELLAWLRQQPLAHWDERAGLLLVHAGVLPQWDLAQVLALAREAQDLLAGAAGEEFLRQKMYGDEPDRWHEQLRGWDRLRLIVNVFTRMRYCTDQGAVSLGYKAAPGGQPQGLQPWFAAAQRRTREVEIVFGHWSMLGRVHWPQYRVWGLDTGAVWGGDLSALRLDDRRVLSVKSKAYSRIE